MKISVNGRLNSALYNEFVATITPLPEGLTKCVIDLANCYYVDSFGLGALIVLWDYAQPKGITVTVLNVQSALKEIFVKAEFDKVFTISYI